MKLQHARLPLELLCVVAIAVALFGCTEVTPVRVSRTLTANAYDGYQRGAARTVDAGATIAYQVDQTMANPYGISGLVLEQPCKVIDHALLDNVVGTRSLELPAGPLHVDAVISKPTKLLLQKFPGNPGKGAALYLAVHPDGTIAPRLWTGWVGEQDLDRNVGSISLEPSDCRYVRTPVSPASLQVTSHRTGVQLVYMGRDPSGLLKFAQVDHGMTLQQTLVPAQPGTYSVLGLSVRIIKVSGYRVTLTIE